MKTLILAVALLALSGCATGPLGGALVDNDLDHAIKIADAFGDVEGKACYEKLKLHNSLGVAGVFSMFEHAKMFPKIEGCLRR